MLPRRVLVIVTRQIGDVLLTTPLIRDVRRLWPNAVIDVLGFAGTLGMLDGNVDVGRRIEVTPRLPLTARLAFAFALWRRHDLAIVTEHSDRAHLYGFMAAPVRIGLVPEREKHAWWKRVLLRHAVTRAGDLGSVHAVAERRRLLVPWHGAVDPAAAVVPPARAPLPESMRQQLRRGYVVVHVPSMWNYKQWPIAHHRRLIRALVDAGLQVVLTGGDSADDRAKIADAARDVKTADRVDATGLGFGQLNELLQGAALYIGPDGSVTHLAAALGVPVLALFGPTNPVRWGPISLTPDVLPWRRRADGIQLRSKIVMLQGSQACVPCGKAGCHDRRDSNSACLQDLHPSRVIEIALELLGARAGARAVRAWLDDDRRQTASEFPSVDVKGSGDR